MVKIIKKVEVNGKIIGEVDILRQSIFDFVRENTPYFPELHITYVSSYSSKSLLVISIDNEKVLSSYFDRLGVDDVNTDTIKTLLHTEITNFYFSTRLRNFFATFYYNLAENSCICFDMLTLKDFISLNQRHSFIGSSQDIAKHKGFGKKTANEFQEFLYKNNLRLDMPIDEIMNI